MSDDHERDIIRHMIDNHAFFQPLNALDKGSVDDFVANFTKVDFKSGDVVCRQKEPGTSVYVIQSGKFDIYTTRRKQDGVTIEEFLVATIGGGTGFGMMEYQYDTPRLGTVVVSDDSTKASCWMVDGDSLAKFIAENELLSKRLRINRLLYKTLADTNLLNNIDEPNIKEELINTFIEERVKPGQNIINQGDEVNDDSKLFVILEGEADAYVEKPFSPTIHSASFKAGDNFGDMSFMYDCPRESTVVASSSCTLLTLKKNQFQALAAKGSSALRSVFDEHALHRSKFRMGAADEMYMSSGQFVEALRQYVMGNERLDAASWQTKLELILELASRCSAGALIPFSEFIKRANLMSKENPEIEIAFRLFDSTGTGSIDTKMFRQVMIDLLQPDECPFNLQSAVSNKVFSSNKTMDASEFREWLHSVGTGKHAWKKNRKMQSLIDAVNDAFLESCQRFSRIGTEEMLAEDGLMTLRAGPGGNSAFPVPYLCAGALAGVVSRTAVYPLTRVKMLMQTGAANNFVKSFRALTPSNAFQGNAANIMRVVPHCAIQFGVYDWLTNNHLQSSPSPTVNIPTRFGYGAIAGLTALTLTFPLDVARARMTVMRGKQKEFNYSSVETLVNLAKNEGFASFYKGIFPAVVSVPVFVGAEFASYEFGKNALGLSPLIAGAFAGGFGSALVYPFETVRRRLQVQGFIKNQSYHYSGFMQGLGSIMAKDGIAGLYRGFVPNLLRIAPAVGTSFAAYEISLPYFRDLWEDHRFERNYEYDHHEHH